MKKVVDDVRLMTKVCDLYYNQNVSQQQIASMLSLSRPTVSRLLSSARERGIVQISVSNLDLIRYWEMERKLEEMYGLKEVLIVDSVEDADEQKKLIGRAAGQYVENTIRTGMWWVCPWVPLCIRWSRTSCIPRRTMSHLFL